MMKNIIPRYPDIYPITTARLRKIEKDWLSELPGFTSKGKPAGIKKRVGPLLIRLSIGRAFRGASDYKPLLFVQNLASVSEFLFISLKQELPKPYTYIHEKAHEAVFKDSVEIMKTIVSIPLLDLLTLDDIFKGYARYMEATEESNKYFISQLEGPPLIAAWAGEAEKAKEYLEWADSLFKNWKENIRMLEGGDQWRLNLEKKIADPERLRQICREEVIKYECEKVPYQNIVGVQYQETISEHKAND